MYDHWIGLKNMLQEIIGFSLQFWWCSLTFFFSDRFYDLDGCDAPMCNCATFFDFLSSLLVNTPILLHSKGKSPGKPGKKSSCIFGFVSPIQHNIFKKNTHEVKAS